MQIPEDRQQDGMTLLTTKGDHPHQEVAQNLVDVLVVQVLKIQNIGSNVIIHDIMTRIIFIFLVCFLCLSCNKNEKRMLNIESVLNTDSIIHFDNDWLLVNDSASLEQIAENVKYVELDLPTTSQIYQLEYTDSLIIVSMKDGVYWFNREGERLNQIPLRFPCFSLSENNDSIYMYEFLEKKISCYDLKDNHIWTSRLHYKEKEVGYYGYSFSLINDTTFVIALRNQGFNSDRLIFADKRGKVLKKISNPETFTYPGRAYVSRMEWQRIVTKNQKQVFYHCLYGDTVFCINEHMQLSPVVIENMIRKVPLSSRPEYTGMTWKEFGTECLEKQMNVTRIFNSSRFIILEAKLGDITNRMSNYWIYDKNNKSVTRSFNNLDNVHTKKYAHFGIHNNYDGGLAFAPDFISNEHLIMVNAGELQGGKSKYAKKLYENKYKIQNKEIRYSSNIYSDIVKKRKADEFWDNHDENKLVLTIVKMKSK